MEMYQSNVPEQVPEEVRLWQQSIEARVAALEAFADQASGGEFTRERERRRKNLGPPDGMEERRADGD